MLYRFGVAFKTPSITQIFSLHCNQQLSFFLEDVSLFSQWQPLRRTKRVQNVNDSLSPYQKGYAESSNTEANNILSFVIPWVDICLYLLLLWKHDKSI